ncbi:hypothetical protein CEUSTIGMA_g2526.t1 [Chlamydomonas eustigma]|uniref:cytidine deaminase n=1 Tax=Chlamydomonas eustigma TaxID=1157962 RepID=A0A250WWU0_9CHLO|nr:hypothetical protein CEUSTIGMA_g2526.t1 [Chlamydomonas eustigma]|eukprot:GAX75082.1 hypothetical protein CEUSTIGMA_g2526.t1 [Chlamydomonas eustigma]
MRAWVTQNGQNFLKFKRTNFHSIRRGCSSSPSIQDRDRCKTLGTSSYDLLQGRFMIPAQEVSTLVTANHMRVEELLSSLIKPASHLARPPISGYHVGAAGVGSSGAVYVGVNLEFPGAPLNNSIHAEQFLVANCILHGEESLSMLAVSAAPCGHCRQFYAELVHSDKVRFIFGEDATPRLLDDLLPSRFGPQDLSPDGPFPLLMQPHDNKVLYSKPTLKLLEERNEDTVFLSAAQAALKEAQKSYTPYTHSPSGASIITDGGHVFSGGYMESAAYNPSLSPFHAAYIHAVTGGMTGFSQIREVVLAEVKQGSAVYHKNNIKLLLKAVAPQANITVLNLQYKSGK